MLGSQNERRGALFLLVILFEIFLGARLEFFSVRPDFFLILIVFWAFVIDRRISPQIGLVLGLIRDIFSAGYFGIETLSYFFVGCLISLLSLKVEKQSFWMRGATIFVFSLIHCVVYAFVDQFVVRETALPGSFWLASIAGSLYTALLGCWLIGFLERRLFSQHSRLLYSS